LTLLTTLREMFLALPRTGILVRVTNMGLAFVLMTLVVAVGATNTGNNGLYVLLSLFLAMLVVSGLVSRRNVERLSVRLDGPGEVFAGQPVRFQLTIRNGGRLPRHALLVKLAGSAAPLLFPRVGAGKEAERGVDLVFPRRGRKRIDSLLVYSGYPIGLFRKGRLHPVGEERLVFPALARVRVPEPMPRPVELGATRASARGRGSEIRHLREAGPGDDPRDLHWPQTARQGRLIVKERAAEVGDEAIVALESGPGSGTPGFPERFDTAVSEAAALALHFLARGQRVGLAAGGQLLAPASGPGQRRALLTVLALLPAGPSSMPPLPPGARVYPVRVAS
jgi:uncharacterized protein (DUF58 family)